MKKVFILVALVWGIIVLSCTFVKAQGIEVSQETVSVADTIPVPVAKGWGKVQGFDPVYLPYWQSPKKPYVWVDKGGNVLNFGGRAVTKVSIAASILRAKARKERAKIGGWYVDEKEQ